MAICKVSLSLSLSLDFCCFCRNMLVGAFLSGWSCWMHMNATKGDQCLGICCGMSFPNIFAEPWIQNNMSHRFTRLFFTRFHTLLNIYIYIYILQMCPTLWAIEHVLRAISCNPENNNSRSIERNKRHLLRCTGQVQVESLWVFGLPWAEPKRNLWDVLETRFDPTIRNKCHGQDMACVCWEFTDGFFPKNKSHSAKKTNVSKHSISSTWHLYDTRHHISLNPS